MHVSDLILENAALKLKVEQLEHELYHFKIQENEIIQEDLLDTVEDGVRMSVGEYWRSIGQTDPRRLWDVE